MIDVRGLGYLVIEATDVAAWRTFGTEVVGSGLAPFSGDDAVYLKTDDRPFRIAVLPGTTDRLICSGWELAHDAAIDDAVVQLEAAGVVVKVASDEEAMERHVRRLLRVTDPGGGDIELFCSPIHDHAPFVSPVGVSGFVSGELGMGHIVMATPAFDETLKFYTEVLSFRESDRMLLDGIPVRFMHTNPRHHSLGLADVPGVQGLAHFMLEARTVDDVGYALDRFVDAGLRIKQGLGRHTNDMMLSFYAQTPAKFDIEFGCGGIKVDDATWTVGEITKTSFWGHRRPPRPPAPTPPAA